MTDLGKGRKAGTLAVCVLAQLLIALDTTVLHLAIPALSEALHPTTTQVLWIADVYGFALAALMAVLAVSVLFSMRGVPKVLEDLDEVTAEPVPVAV